MGWCQVDSASPGFEPWDLNTCSMCGQTTLLRLKGASGSPSRASKDRGRVIEVGCG